MNETPTLPASTLVKNQKQIHGWRVFSEGNHTYRIKAEVRHDDECGNGHNSFSITAIIEEKQLNGWLDYACGCCHEEIAKHFPELAPFIKWHLTSTDGPIHYVANTLYWLGFSGWCDGKAGSPPNFEYATSSAVWPDMPESFLAAQATQAGQLRGSLSEQGEQVKTALVERLAGLMAAFKADVEKLGLVY